MDRCVIRKRKVASDTEEESSPPPSCSPDLNDRPEEIPTTSALTGNLAEGEGDPSEKTVPGTKRKPGRQFQERWKQTYRWLSYDVTSDKAFCNVCRSADTMNVPLPNTSRDKGAREAFVQYGFSTWVRALATFKSHQKSNLHRAAVQASASMTAGVDVGSQLSEDHQKHVQGSRKALLTILSSVKYLASQGLAIHGQEEKDSNLKQLLLLRAHDVPQLEVWLNRTSDRWISPAVVDEMLELMAQHVLRRLLRETRAAVYYSVIVDEAAATQEQVSFCFRVATEEMIAEEFFLGLHETATTPNALFSLLKEVLRRFDLPLDRCRGQCYDGVANVAGRLGGVQALVRAEEPRALCVHRLAHVVDWVAYDLSENIPMCKHFLSEFSDMTAFVQSSPKRLHRFKHFPQAEGVNPKPFCPVGWAVGAASLKSASLHYRELIQFFENVSSEGSGNPAAKAHGYAQSLLKFSSYFMLQLLLLVFGRLDALDAALQKTSLQFRQAAQLLAAAEDGIQQLWNNFEQFWSQTVKAAKDLKLKTAAVPRGGMPTRCADAGGEPHPFPSPKNFYRIVFCETVDHVSSSLQRRFFSDASQHMRDIEKFVLGEEDATHLANFYKTDLEADQLRLHRDMFLDIARRRNVKPSHFGDVVALFQGEQGKTLQQLLPELAKLIRIGLTIPVSPCTSERSFSCLRRIKTFLHSNTGQGSLSHAAILHGHEQLTREIDLDAVANEFIQKAPARINTFNLA